MALPSESLFVGDLPSNVDDTIIQTVFGAYGSIKSWKVLPPSVRGQGNAIVSFGSVEEAKWVVENLNGNIPQGLTEPVTISFKQHKRDAMAASSPGMAAAGGMGAAGGGGSAGAVDTLFIGDLPAEMDDAMLQTVFGTYGSITSHKVLGQGQFGKRAAIVTFGSVEEASWIVDNLHGNIPNGLSSPIVVRYKNQGKQPAAVPPSGGMSLEQAAWVMNNFSNSISQAATAPNFKQLAATPASVGWPGGAMDGGMGASAMGAGAMGANAMGAAGLGAGGMGASGMAGIGAGGMGAGGMGATGMAAGGMAAAGMGTGGIGAGTMDASAIVGVGAMGAGAMGAGGNGASPGAVSTLFIGDLPPEMDDAKLQAIFGAYGAISSHKLLPVSPLGKRAAIVTFASVEAAAFILENLHGNIPQGLTNPIVVRYKPASGTSSAGAPSAAGWTGGGMSASMGASGMPGIGAGGMVGMGAGGMPGMGAGGMGAGGMGAVGVGAGAMGGGAMQAITMAAGGMGAGSTGDSAGAVETLFIGDLPPDMDDVMLHTVFGAYGNIKSHKLLAVSPLGKRAAIVTFENVEVARVIVDNLHGGIPEGLTTPIVARYKPDKEAASAGAGGIMGGSMGAAAMGAGAMGAAAMGAGAMGAAAMGAGAMGAGAMGAGAMVAGGMGAGCMGAGGMIAGGMGVGGMGAGGMGAGAGGMGAGGMGGGVGAVDTLFIGDLPPEMDDAMLHTVFGAYGNITSHKLLPVSPLGKRAAIVTFESVEVARVIVDNLHGGIPEGLTTPIVARYKNQGKQPVAASSAGGFAGMPASWSTLGVGSGAAASAPAGGGYGPAGTEPSNTLFVGDLPLQIDEETLKAVISSYGTVTSVKMLQPGTTGAAAIVNFASQDEAKWCVANLNNNIPQGLSSPIKCQFKQAPRLQMPAPY